jgi:hypothetical protein
MAELQPSLNRPQMWQKQPKTPKPELPLRPPSKRKHPSQPKLFKLPNKPKP